MSQPDQHFDAIVIGIGGMGSAAVYHLASRGWRVLGLEQYDIPHSMGSSHGVTRIIRKAYFEHPSYVPLLVRAYELWNEIQDRAGEKLLHITGSVDIGRPGSRVLDGSIDSCKTHALAHQILDADALNERFPGYSIPSTFRAVWQPEGGFLLSEQCIVAYCFAALSAGARIHGREQVVRWSQRSGTFEVHTTRGTYFTSRLIVTAGSWAGTLLTSLAPNLSPERQVLGWFQPGRPEYFDAARFPVFNMTVDEGHFYGFPVYGVPGFKLGRYHHLNEIVDADSMDREVHDRDEAILREFVRKYFPDALGPTLALKPCMFTNTPDEHFIVDRHPEYAGLSIAAGFSGHGFKFASVIGEILADLAMEGSTQHDIALFAINRFTNNKTPM